MLTGYLYIGSDRMDTGIPCGKSWISPRKKCSAEGKAYTKANRQGDRDKAAQRLKEERKLKSYAKRKMTRPEIEAEEKSKAEGKQKKRDVDALRNKDTSLDEKLAAFDRLKKQGVPIDEIKEYGNEGFTDEQRAEYLARKGAKKKPVEPAKNKAPQKKEKTKPESESESKSKDPAQKARKIERKAGEQSAGGPIKDQETFDYEITRAFDQINRDNNQNNYVRISKVREVLGERVTDKQFNDFMLKASSNDRFELDPDDQDSGSEGCVTTALGKKRCYMKPGSKKISVPLSKIDDVRDGKKTGKPPIKSADEFKQKTLDTIKQLDQEKGYTGLVPIYQIRRSLGDQVNRREFSEWLFKMQDSGEIELSEGSVEDSARDKIEDSVTTKMGKLRGFARILKDRKDSFIHIPTLERNHQASVNQGMAMLYTLESAHYDSGYIHIDWERLDAVCKSPDDKDARGRRCVDILSVLKERRFPV